MNKYLLEQLKTHPAMEPQDIVKLCYQAAYGAEHLLEDVKQARRHLYAEFEETEPAAVPVYENISDEYCRVNITGWKHHGRPKEDLFELFRRTAGAKGEDKDEAKPAKNQARRFQELMAEYLETAKQVMSGEKLQALQAYLEAYNRKGIRPVRHSEKYREAENPHYRVVRRDLLPKEIVRGQEQPNQKQRS